MVRINLLRTSKVREKKRPAVSIQASDMTKQLGLAAVFVVTLAVCAYFWFSIQGRLDNLRNEVASATRERDRLRSVKELVDRLEKERDRLNQRLEVLSDLKNNLRSPLHSVFFVYVAQQQNKGVTLSKITESAGAEGAVVLTITGEGSRENFNKFSETLMNEDIVRRFDIQSQIGEKFEVKVTFSSLNGFNAETTDEEGQTAAGSDGAATTTGATR